MRIIFIGCSKSSEVLLEQCFKIKLNIVGVCTKKKSWNFDFCDLKRKFNNKNVPIKYFKSANSNDCFEWVKNKKPDLIFCFGWSELLKNKIINLPKINTIGFHPTKLPYNRGRHPIIWTIALGLKKTATTFFIIEDENADSGKIINQKQITINQKDTSFTLYKKILYTSKNQIVDVVNFFRSKKKILNKNIITKNSNIWRQRSIDDGKIDWRMSVMSVDRLVRSLSKPYMYSHFNYKKELIKVIKSKIIRKKDNIEIQNIEPGKILNIKKNYFDVKCGEGIIRILKIHKKINLKDVKYL